jgi:O-antigen/teichoic acid export membrane protein
MTLHREQYQPACGVNQDGNPHLCIKALSISGILHTVLNNKKVVKQTSYLFGSYLLLIIVGFGIKKLQTLGLGDLDYGRYTFFISVTSFLILFLRFGFFESIRVLLAKNSNPLRERKLLAVGVVMALVCGLCVALSVFLLSFFIDGWFDTDINLLLRRFSPLTVAMPFLFLITGYSTGTNKILVNALYGLLPKMLFLLIIWIIYARTGDLTLNQNIFWNLLSSIILTAILIKSLKPDFSGFKRHLNLVLLKNKKFGRHYNLGAIANQSTYRLDEIFITSFLNTTSLGFYSLTMFICSPMIQLSQAVTSSMFKRFADMKSIPPKLHLYNIAWLVGCVIFLYFAKELIVDLIFTPEFAEIADYVFPMSIAFLIHGLSIPYSFLTAKSLGKEIRNVAWVEAIVNVLGNFFLISAFGIMGAIYASIVSKVVHYALIRYYYHNFLKQQQSHD